MNYYAVTALRLPKPNQNEKQLVDDIIDNTCAYYEVSINSVKGKSRKRIVVKARHIIMYLLRMKTGLTLEEVGKQMGGRHYSTCIHAVQMVNDYLSHPYDKTTQKDLENLNILI